MQTDAIFAPGRTVTADLGHFRLRITFLSEDRLHLSVQDGPESGFIDNVSCSIEPIGSGVTLLSWRERNGSCVVHVIDRTLATHVFIARADGRFQRLKGRIRPD